ncbi:MULTISPECIES: hypothetical protein [unclassified Brevundimonas]|uniref:hypothetical protein n=1 Tax=unclassified Brevundimonas TaxID=2622653 RepID=UPI0006F4D37F|nr:MULTISPECIES: hypothetical protein [unclassified Brevundimonas]KQY73172.1 hypothetical protein ASD25_27485 [Brevundimonas sp. Root1423]KRA19260.1 hypothetical protein ASD59_12965 [Brevundimonas sp. Root608]
MFGKFPRRNNRKARISRWFASERGSDLHTFDLHDLGSRLGALVSALLRARTVRRAADKA